MSKRLDRSYVGSISHGTLREEDLIPKFESLILSVQDLPKDAPHAILDKQESDWTVEERVIVGYYLEELFDILDDIAPLGTYFGAAEGDGADYGFWDAWDGTVDNLDDFTREYAETALWSSSAAEGEPLDQDYSLEDLDPETLRQMREDCLDFQEQAGALLDDLARARVAHDFWLTRNRHGAGFWDGNYPESIGQALTRLAHSFGTRELYVGDSGTIFQT